MQSCASPAWLVRKAGLRVKPTFNAAYTNPRMKSNHPGVSFEAAISPASFTCILSCNWESPTQEPAWRNWRWWHCNPGCWCHVLSTEIHQLRRLCTSQGKSPRSVLRPPLPARWDHADVLDYFMLKVCHLIQLLMFIAPCITKSGLSIILKTSFSYRAAARFVCVSR